MSLLDQFRLDGKAAVITGGGKGIGRGIALAYAEAGAKVALSARTQSDLDGVVAEIQAMGGEAIAVACDVTNSEDLQKLGEACVATFGSLDIWVNNAGGLPDGTPRYLTRTPEDKFQAQIDLNLKAVWAGCSVAAGLMGETGGAIVNISSRAAFGPQIKNGPYGASKAAVNSLTQTFSIELAPKVRVNAIGPGPVITQNFRDSMNMHDEKREQGLVEYYKMPLARFGTVEDVAAAAVYLASPASSWVTGQCLYVTGGL